HLRGIKGGWDGGYGAYGGYNSWEELWEEMQNGYVPPEGDYNPGGYGDYGWGDYGSYGGYNGGWPGWDYPGGDYGGYGSYGGYGGYGGYGSGVGIEGWCYFYTLDYLSTYLGGSTDINGYISMFGQEYGYMPGEMLPNRYQGTSRSEYIQFTSYMFNSRYMYTDAQVNQNLNAGNPVMAVLDRGSGVGHSVVIQGYNQTTGQYTYIDPSNTSAGQQTASLNDFVMGNFIAVGSSGATFY